MIQFMRIFYLFFVCILTFFNCSYVFSYNVFNSDFFDVDIKTANVSETKKKSIDKITNISLSNLSDKILNNHFKKTIIPIGSLTKPPSAELSEDQVDPFDYEKVSPIVDKIINNLFNRDDLLKLNYDSELIDDIISRISKSEYKRRQAPPGIKVSKKAFGMGRRFPINNQYEFIDE